MSLKQPISLIDIETTGLDKVNNSILEISIITLTDLHSSVEDMPSLDILFTHKSSNRLLWHSVAHDMHKSSGLTNLLFKDADELINHNDESIRKQARRYDYIFSTIVDERNLIRVIIENYLMYNQKVKNIKDVVLGGVNFRQFDFPFLTQHGLLSSSPYRFVEVNNIAAQHMYQNNMIDEFYIPGSKEFYSVLVPGYDNNDRHIARFDNLAATKSLQICLKKP